MSQQKQIQLAKRPKGLPTKDVFHFEQLIYQRRKMAKS